MHLWPKHIYWYEHEMYISVIYCINTRKKKKVVSKGNIVTSKVLKLLLKSMKSEREYNWGIVLGLLKLLVVPKNQRRFIILYFRFGSSVLFFIIKYVLFLFLIDQLSPNLGRIESKNNIWLKIHFNLKRYLVEHSVVQSFGMF